MSETLAEAVVVIKANNAHFRQKLQETKQEAEKGTNRLRQIFGGLSIGLGVSQGLSALNRKLDTGMQSFRSYEATLSRIQNVFGDTADEVTALGKAFAEDTGLSATLFSGRMAEMESVLRGLDMPTEESFGMSKTLAGLATDLRSFFDLASDEEAMRKLRSGITGETEALKQLGIVINETRLKQEAMEVGIDPKQMSEQEKVMLRFRAIMESTAHIQGDFIRTQQEVGNQEEILRQKGWEASAKSAKKYAGALLEVEKKYSDINIAIDEYLGKLAESETGQNILAGAKVAGDVAANPVGSAVITGASAVGTMAAAPYLGAGAAAIGGAVLSPVGIAAGTAVAAPLAGQEIFRRAVDEPERQATELGDRMETIGNIVRSINRLEGDVPENIIPRNISRVGDMPYKQFQDMLNELKAIRAELITTRAEQGMSR